MRLHKHTHTYALARTHVHAALSAKATNESAVVELRAQLEITRKELRRGFTNIYARTYTHAQTQT